MAHGVGVLSFASDDTITWYSKQARIAVAYQLVLVRCVISTVASSVVVTRRLRSCASAVPGIQETRCGALAQRDRFRSVSLARILATHLCTGRTHGSAEGNAAKKVGGHAQNCASWRAGSN